MDQFKFQEQHMEIFLIFVFVKKIQFFLVCIIFRIE